MIRRVLRWAERAGRAIGWAILFAGVAYAAAAALHLIGTHP